MLKEQLVALYSLTAPPSFLAYRNWESAARGREVNFCLNKIHLMVLYLQQSLLNPEGSRSGMQLQTSVDRATTLSRIFALYETQTF